MMKMLKKKTTTKKTRGNALMDPQQQLFNNFDKVQFWAKFELLSPMGPGQESSQKQHIHSRKCLISVKLHTKNQKHVSHGSEDIFKVNFEPKI